MGVFTTTLKTHSREDITDKCGELNNCIVHGCKPQILKIIAGKRKELFVVASCEDDECGKISTTIEATVAAWNKWNPKPLPESKLHLPSRGIDGNGKTNDFMQFLKEDSY